MSNTRTTTPPKGRPTPARKPPAVTFKILGGEYRVADKTGIWPLMQYARAVESGETNIGERRAMAAAHALLEDAVHPEDWGRFQDDMIAKKMTDLRPVLEAVMNALASASTKPRNGRAKPVTAEIVP